MGCTKLIRSDIVDVDWAKMASQNRLFTTEDVIQLYHLTPKQTTATIMQALRKHIIHSHKQSYSMSAHYLDKLMDKHWLDKPVENVHCDKCAILVNCRQHVMQGGKLGCEA